MTFRPLLDPVPVRSVKVRKKTAGIVSLHNRQLDDDEDRSLSENPDRGFASR